MTLRLNTNPADPGPTVALLNANQTFTGTNTFSNDIILEDAVDLALGTGSDALMRWSTGDADNHALVVGLGDSNQALHITDNGAVATDWNIAATTDPNVYIHSNTTPATDYLRLGDHDGTTAYVDVVGGTTLALEIGGTTEASLTASALNLASGNEYQIDGTSVLNATTLGSWGDGVIADHGRCSKLWLYYFWVWKYQ